MYSGHLAQIGALYESISGDLSPTSSGWVFDNDSGFKQNYTLLSLLHRIRDQMEEDETGGVCCEPTEIYFVCNHHPRAAFKLFDAVHGSDFSNVDEKWRSFVEKTVVRHGIFESFSDGFFNIFYERVIKNWISPLGCAGNDGWALSWLFSWEGEEEGEWEWTSTHSTSSSRLVNDRSGRNNADEKRREEDVKSEMKEESVRGASAGAMFASGVRALRNNREWKSGRSSGEAYLSGSPLCDKMDWNWEVSTSFYLPVESLASSLGVSSEGSKVDEVHAFLDNNYGVWVNSSTCRGKKVEGEVCENGSAGYFYNTSSGYRIWVTANALFGSIVTYDGMQRLYSKPFFERMR